MPIPLQRPRRPAVALASISVAVLVGAAAPLAWVSSKADAAPEGSLPGPEGSRPATGESRPALQPARSPDDSRRMVAARPAADTLERLAASATAAVVLIDVQTASGTRQGSGFLVDRSGRILTNHHVIRDARSARIRLASGDVYDQVTVLGADERRDIAVLQIAGFDLPALSLGNSDSVRVGAHVVVIGSPLGLENTVSTGIVSGRRQESEGYQLLQISAPTSTGSSGGPVISRDGDVIGIAVSQMRGGQNLNFAVPINYARGLLTHLDRQPVQQPVAVLAPQPSPSNRTATRQLARPNEVNQGLRFDLDRFGGYRVEMEGRKGEDRWYRTRVTYLRIETVGAGEPRIERYSETETTQKSGPFGTPETIRRERSRTIVSVDDLRPISARGEIVWRSGGDWQKAEYDLRFEGYRVRGILTDTTGRASELDRELPPGIILREMRHLAFATLAHEPLVGRSVEFVTFDSRSGEVTRDRYDVRDAATVRVAGRSYRALRVNLATGLSNSAAYFRVQPPRILLREEGSEEGDVEEVTQLEFFDAPPAGRASGRPESRSPRRDPAGTRGLAARP